ncbi:MAG: hypothetical protein LBV43_11145 [Prevotella sp.]|jgi:C-terminal processing protease CtpA/Prc|nr:hypothetical protein [Prevotella sp.]
MNRILLIISLLVFTLVSCEQKKDNSMIIEEGKVLPLDSYHLSNNTWARMAGDITIDTLNLYEGEKSLKLTPTEMDTLKVAIALFRFDLSTIEGNSISVSGKYRMKKSEDAKTHLMIFQQMSFDTILIEPGDDLQWKDFEIKVPVKESVDEAMFFIEVHGDTELSISGCQAKIDDIPFSDLINREYPAEKDYEFNNASNILLGELTPQMAENLEVLGKVWGFLKYYHPKVTQGNYNWDFELFRILPEIADTKNKEERNKLLNKWIDKYGEIKETADYTITDSAQYTRFVDLGWLQDKSLFDDELITKLQQIKSAKRSKKINYYVVLHKSGARTPISAERAYENIEWYDQGFRILTLFRLWNMIEYCFPYTHYTDIPWETLLKEFIPKFVSAKDQAEYELAILELAAKIDDSHGYINIKGDKLAETPIGRRFMRKRVPVELIRSAEGLVVVETSNSQYIHRGDIILEVEGKDVDAIIGEMKPYTIASNKNGLYRNTIPYLLKTTADKLNIRIQRGKEKITTDMTDFRSIETITGRKSWKDYDLDKKDIIHLDDTKSAGENKDLVQNNMNSKGLIIDLRKYPKEYIRYVSPLLLSKYPLWISENDHSYPGNYSTMPGYDVIPETEKEANYKGKVVILVNEHTQSAGETAAMMHRLAPNSIIIGRQTAGANGNICEVRLPGNIDFKYTQLGAYYPRWEILQRKGVKIDVEVSPTVDDIREGRDVWIEKAIEIIEGK